MEIGKGIGRVIGRGIGREIGKKIGREIGEGDCGRGLQKGIAEGD